MTFLKMCDDKLDTVPEGLCARVSMLEERLAALSNGVIPLTANAPAPSKTAAAPQPQQMNFKKSVQTDDKKSELKLSDPKSVPQRQGLKPVSWWVEATKRVSETSPSVSPFMRLSRAYENGDKILIRVDGMIAKDMLDTPQTRAMLSSLASSIASVMITPDKFEFMETGNTVTELTPLDELQNV